MDNYSLLSILVSIKPLLDPLLRPAAYLDPGSGSYLIQILIAFLLGAAFAIRAFWGKIKASIKKFFSRSTNEGENE